MNIKPGLILPPRCAETTPPEVIESFETQEEVDTYFKNA